MPRLFFDLDDGTTRYADTTGNELSDIMMVPHRVRAGRAGSMAPSTVVVFGHSRPLIDSREQQRTIPPHYDHLRICCLATPAAIFDHVEAHSSRPQQSGTEPISSGVTRQRNESAFASRIGAFTRHSLTAANNATDVNGLRKQQDAPSSSASLRKSGVGSLAFAKA